MLERGATARPARHVDAGHHAEAGGDGSFRALAKDLGADCGNCRLSRASVYGGVFDVSVLIIAPVPAVLSFCVVCFDVLNLDQYFDVPVLVQLQFQQSSPNVIMKVPQIQFIVRLRELPVLSQRWVLTVQTVQKIVEILLRRVLGG